MANDDLDEAQELLRRQQERERVERDLAHQAPEAAEALQHERRSDKAHYLREKLQERVDSERDD